MTVEGLEKTMEPISERPRLERDEDVEILVDSVRLAGHLTAPTRSKGIVVFAHGSGSSRHSPRNRSVADVLNRGGLATLLFDLLTADEERSRANVFDIDLLSERLALATRWLIAGGDVADVPVGYFGSSTGAAAALCAAVRTQPEVTCVVSRGGRPDLAGPCLSSVTVPTLLIVGERDATVLELNRQAQQQLGGESLLSVVPGATHLFEEPGTLREAAVLARDWFMAHLAA